MVIFAAISGSKTCAAKARSSLGTVWAAATRADQLGAFLMLGGTPRDDQTGRNFGVAVSPRHKGEHLHLAAGKRHWQMSGRDRHQVARGGKHRMHRIRVEDASACLLQ